MKLAALLESLNVPMREEIRRHNGWEEEAGTLEQLLADERKISELNGSLYDLEIKTLTLVLRTFGYKPFDWPKLEKAGRKAFPGAALKVGLIRLSRRGIVFAIQRKWGEAEHRVAEDTFPLWRRQLLPFDQTAAVYAGSDAASDSDYRPGIPSQLLSVLAYTAKEEVALTQKGTMHKRHAGKLSALTPVKDEEFRDAGTLLRPDPDYGSAAAAYLCAMGQSLGLLEKADGRLAVRNSLMRGWLRQTEAEMHAVLYALWKEMNAPRCCWLQHAVSCIEQMPESVWISVCAVAEQMPGESEGLTAGRLTGDSPSRSGLLMDWLSPLIAWGWAESGATPDGKKLFRWLTNPAGSKTGGGTTAATSSSRDEAVAAPCLFIQPDFELIVPPDCPYGVRWELELIADRIRHEHMAVYRMTRETIMRALEQGRTADGTVGFLELHAKHGVPDNVRVAIQQWGEQQSQLRLAPYVVLKCRDEAAARMIGGDERIAPLLGETLGPAAWTVPAEKEAELRALLERSGYSPGGKKGAEGGTAVYLQLPAADDGDFPDSRSGEPADNPAKGHIYSKATVQYYGKEGKFPLVEDVYPGLQEVPSMWLKDCRAYHASTRKQMILKALEWKACLKLRKSGADTVFIPIRLDGIRDDWAVTGFEQLSEVRISPDQWEEMQLILPGIND
ncbi:helicase-associated domain-containing protein [Paenibacillus oceani]|uniref:Helicase-associated domain-containing protein n=1 Tax=Paenibacillus oceani TaxID=2772510 RepID=A0A927GZG2_9BACL|nr:helicase-associated domain-containing protein [Paenibacillus oceani]MBD2862610.1 helicase-associated domain-containing protein [Paenibacillus oceani]